MHFCKNRPRFYLEPSLKSVAPAMERAACQMHQMETMYLMKIENFFFQIGDFEANIANCDAIFVFSKRFLQNSISENHFRILKPNTENPKNQTTTFRNHNFPPSLTLKFDFASKFASKVDCYNMFVSHLTLHPKIFFVKVFFNVTQ